MHMAADMSFRMGWIDRPLVDRTVELMKKARLPVELPKGAGMTMDKFLDVSFLQGGVLHYFWYFHISLRTPCEAVIVFVQG